MTTQASPPANGEPLFAMPPATERALRAAVTRLDPTEAIRFENEFRAARQEAARLDDTVPMHIFLYRWAVFVELRRHPDRARRLHDLEKAVAESDDSAAARQAAAKIADLLDAARRDVVA